MIGAAIGSAVIGASSASKAAKAQTNAANSDRALQKELYEDQKSLFKPFYDDGLDYAKVRNYLDGIGERPTFGGQLPEIQTNTIAAIPATNTRGSVPLDGTPVPIGGGTAGTPASTTYSVGGNSFASLDEAQQWAQSNRTGGTPYAGMQETDAYKFRVNQGVNAIEAGAAARSGLYSGNTMQALQTLGIGEADQFENNYYSRVSGGAAQGQAAAAQTAQAGQNYGQASSNAFSNIGNAQAAGAIGVGNAIQGGINNGIGIYQYQNQLNKGGGGGGSNWLFGGNSWG